MDDIDLSTAPSEQIKVVDENTAIKYSVVSETIDVKALRDELANLEAMPEPPLEELANIGRMYHPYFLNRVNRINELKDKIATIEAA